MRLLLFLLCLAIAYGSLFPFRFRPLSGSDDIVARLLQDWRQPQEKADIIANILMFLPYGFLAAALAQRHKRVAICLATYVFAGGVLAFALQIGQLWLPARVASLSDLVLNLIGIAAGVAVGFNPWLRLSDYALHARRDIAVPVLLIALLLAFRLFPYLPSFDVQNLKNNLKPLISGAAVTPQAVLHDTVLWLAAGSMLRRIAGNGDALLLPALIVATLCAELIVIHNGVYPDDIVAAGVALAIWFAWLARSTRSDGHLACLLAATIIVLGLAPFELRAQPAELNLAPFSAYLAGSLWHGLQTLMLKSFLYGSLIWLARNASNSMATATIVSTLLCLALEIAQIYFAGHSPDLGDPIHALLLAFTFFVIESRNSARGVAARNGDVVARPGA